MSEPTKSINMLELIVFKVNCIRNLRLRCNCGNVWQEEVPTEIFQFKTMATRFICIQCGASHILEEGKFRIISKETWEKTHEQQTHKTYKFDA